MIVRTAFYDSTLSNNCAQREQATAEGRDDEANGERQAFGVYSTGLSVVSCFPRSRASQTIADIL